jgi:hypothetical protein
MRRMHLTYAGCAPGRCGQVHRLNDMPYSGLILDFGTSFPQRRNLQ